MTEYLVDHGSFYDKKRNKNYVTMSLLPRDRKERPTFASKGPTFWKSFLEITENKELLNAVQVEIRNLLSDQRILTAQEEEQEKNLKDYKEGRYW